MITCIVLTDTETGFFEEVAKANCSEAYVDTILDTISENVNTIFRNNIINIGIVGLFILSDMYNMYKYI